MSREPQEPRHEAPPQEDWAELWGRRIGRSLAVLAGLGLAYYLFATYLR